jgi:PAS domain S-box-containing protein
MANSDTVSATHWGKRNVFRNLFRRNHWSIGTRLTACFVALLLLMLALDVIAVWQFSRIAVAVERLNQADQASLAIVRVHLDVYAFRDRLVELASSRDTRQFASEAASIRRKFQEDVAHARELLRSSPSIEQDQMILSGLETLQVTLPAQLDALMDLAAAGDWPAVRLRLAEQVPSLIDLSSMLVERIDREVLQVRADAIASLQRTRRQLYLVGPVTALLTLLIAVALGWYTTRAITDPLSELDAGARALGRGEFEYEVDVRGEDELARLGKAFNYATRRIRELYESVLRSEKQLRDVIETIPAMAWTALPDGSNAFTNRQWVEYTGLAVADTAGSGWQAVVHPKDMDRHVEKWRSSLTTGRPFENEMRLRRAADGKYRWFLVRGVPQLDEQGNILKWYGIATDIEDRKRAEEELRQAQAAQFEINLETRVRERTRIARELHDTLLQNFQGLLLRFQSVLKMLPERPLEARQRLESALHQAAEAITDARDAIQGLRAMVAESDDLARAVTAVGEELAAHRTDSNSPAIHLEVKGTPRNLNPVVRDEAYGIASEALRNAFRHAQAQRIIVEIQYDKQQFRLRVRDDGKGIDEETLRQQSARHFGLPGMRERAEIVGGCLEVWSRLGSGTQVELSIPGATAYDMSPPSSR